MRVNQSLLQRMCSVNSSFLLTTTLIACGGGGSNNHGTASGLLPEAAGCQYIIDITQGEVTAAELNQFGCTYALEDGSVAYWAGTDGTWGPNADGANFSWGTSAISPTANPADFDNETTTEITDPVTDTSGSLTFPAVIPLSPALSDLGFNSQLYGNTANSAVLFGPLIGAGLIPNSQLRKSIPFNIENADTGLSIEHVLIVGDKQDRSYAIQYIRNSTSELRCFVKVTDLGYYDSNGKLIENNPLVSEYVSGVTGMLSIGGITTGTCIPPGETNYLIDRVNSPMENVDAVAIGNLTSISSAAENVSQAIEPVSYSVNGSDIDITITNRGSAIVDIGVVDLVALDNEGFPIGVDSAFGDEIEPGSELVVSFPSSEISGSSSVLRVIADFDFVEP